MFKKTLCAFVILAVAVVETPVLALAGCSSNAATEDKYKYALSFSSTAHSFQSLENVYDLPKIISDDPSFDYEWDDPIGAAVSKLDGEDKYTVNSIFSGGSETSAQAVFTARITGSGGITDELKFTVTVRDRGSNVFDTLFTSQRGSVDYESYGIGKSRVFGLYDVSLPEGGVTAANFSEVDYVKSFDEFDLMWRYRGDSVRIDVWLMPVVGTDVATLTDNEGEPVEALTYYTGGDDRTVRIDFNKVGTVKLIAQAAEAYHIGGAKATWEYTYKIVDAVNVRDFEDIKLMERLARYDYITDEAEKRGLEVSDYIIDGNEDGLLSKHFKTTETPYETNSKVVFDEGNTKLAADNRVGAFFNEFNLWTPEYRYKDIVIRSASKETATRRMYTWAESTWFFGSVYGNGYELNATTYTRGVAGYEGEHYEYTGRYYNTHSMRGNSGSVCACGELICPIPIANRDSHARFFDGKQNTSPSLGFDGKKFFAGYGWGEVFAFYALANNSVIDNVTMTGEDIPQKKGEVITLNRYSKIGVLGVSTLAGDDRAFSAGHPDSIGTGTPIEGRYNENITVQNSVLQKGLTLFGANYAPNGAKPLVADTCVFRYAAFSAVTGNAYGGGVGPIDYEGGKDIANNNTLSRDISGNELRGNDNNYYGNFVVARNNIYHDISVTPLLTMSSWSGSHISVEGSENGFFTWLKSNDLQFPTMSNDSFNNEGEYSMAGQNLNDVLPGMMSNLFSSTPKRINTSGGNRINGEKNNLIARHDTPGGSYVVNIPYISVVDSGQWSTHTIAGFVPGFPSNADPDNAKHNRNTVSFKKSSLDGIIRDDFGITRDAGGITQLGGAQPQGFYFMMIYAPKNAPPSANLVRWEDQTREVLDKRISDMSPAGLDLAAIARRTVLLDSSTTDETVIDLYPLYNVSLEAYEIRYNGTVVGAEYFENYFEVTIAELKAVLGSEDDISFGIYQFDLTDVDGKTISSFMITFCGDLNDGEEFNASPGTEGYIESNSVISFPFYLESSNTYQGLFYYSPTAGAVEVKSSRYEDGEISFNPGELPQEFNSLTIRTQMLNVNVSVTIKELQSGATVGIVNNDSDLVITMWEDIVVEGGDIEVSYNGQAFDYITNGQVITISNAGLQLVMGEEYGIGLHEIVIKNNRYLDLAKNLIITDKFTAPIIETVFTPVLWKNKTHDDYGDLVFSLVTQGEDILSVTVGNTTFPYGVNGIWHDAVTGLFTVPATLFEESNTGYINVSVTTVMGKSANAGIQICDSTHPDGAAFAQKEYTVRLSSLVTPATDKVDLYFESPVRCGTVNMVSSSNFTVGKVAVTLYDDKGEIIDRYTRNNNNNSALKSGGSVYSISWITSTGGLLGTGSFYDGITISGSTLRALGAGTYTIEIRSNHNIDIMTLIVRA